MTGDILKAVCLVIAVFMSGVGALGCVPSTPSPQDQPSAPSASVSAKRIAIEYSSATAQQIGEWTKAKPGYVYLVLD